MNEELSDAQALARFAAGGNHADLTVLVHRYVDLVYSAARRQLRDAHAAQDVVQQVFIILLRKGRKLRPDTILAAWLLKVTALECRNALRTQARRQRRERKVAQMTSQASGRDDEIAQKFAGDPAWEELAPHLDAALDTLSAGDRQAVVMRYFLNRSYEQAAALLGASEGSVRQRVHRGVGKMRKVLSARGVITSEAALTAAILTHAVTTAPATVSAAAVAAVGNAALTPVVISKGVLTLMSATSPVKVAVVIFVLAVAVSLTAVLWAKRSNGGDALAAGSVNTTQPATTQAALPTAPVVIDTPAPAAPVAKPAPPAAPPVLPRKLFDVITAQTCNARQGPKNGFEHLAYINRGDWVEYDGVEFPPGDQAHLMAFCAVVACPAQYAGNEIQVHIGSPDGPTIATLTVEATAGYGDWVCQETGMETTLSGPQDIFLVFTGGGFNLKSIKFAVLDGRSATDRIAATGYVMAKKVNEGARALVNVRDGAWARYDCLEFPEEGAETFTLSYAVDAVHAPRGTIAVRIGLPTSPPVCEIPVISTGGYNQFFTRTVTLEEAVKGKHDVYLTFSGTDRGYFGLADVAWFKFNKPGAAAVSGPPAPPHPTSRPLSLPAAGAPNPFRF